MRAIIADTGPLYAAIDIDDQYHQRSKTQIQRINAENLTILVPFPVYLETYSNPEQFVRKYGNRKKVNLRTGVWATNVDTIIRGFYQK